MIDVTDALKPIHNLIETAHILDAGPINYTYNYVQGMIKHCAMLYNHGTEIKSEIVTALDRYGVALVRDNPDLQLYVVMTTGVTVRYALTRHLDVIKFVVGIAEPEETFGWYFKPFSDYWIRFK